MMGYLSACIVYFGFGVDLSVVWGFVFVALFSLPFAFAGEYFYRRKENE